MPAFQMLFGVMFSFLSSFLFFFLQRSIKLFWKIAIDGLLKFFLNVTSTLLWLLIDLIVLYVIRRGIFWYFLLFGGTFHLWWCIIQLPCMTLRCMLIWFLCIWICLLPICSSAWKYCHISYLSFAVIIFSL